MVFITHRAIYHCIGKRMAFYVVMASDTCMLSVFGTGAVSAEADFGPPADMPNRLPDVLWLQPTSKCIHGVLQFQKCSGRVPP